MNVVVPSTGSQEQFCYKIVSAFKILIRLWVLHDSCDNVLLRSLVCGQSKICMMIYKIIKIKINKKINLEWWITRLVGR